MWECILTEYPWRSDKSVEVYRCGEHGSELVWAYLKDGEYILFESLGDLMAYLVEGNTDVNRKYFREDDLDAVLESGTNFHNIKTV